VSPRDSQRSKVYKAEQAAFNPFGDVGVMTLSTVPEMQAYVDHMRASKWWEGCRYPKITITVTDGRGRSRFACATIDYRGRVIKMPSFARKNWVVLHEVAHHIAREQGSGWLHDWRFCEIYLDLVRRMMGKAAHDALRASFKKHGVRINAPRKKREISAEQREALVTRLAAARAAKAAKVAS
jgi:putative metallohydrolase (TIGR04338 family)